MTTQEAIEAMQPTRTYYDPLFTMPGNWVVEKTEDGGSRVVFPEVQRIEARKENDQVLLIAGALLLVVLMKG